MARLAIETSQRLGSVALDLGDAIDEEPLRTGTGRRHHDDDLLPAIDRLTRRHAVSPGAIESVAVSIGPGGFTGLRIAVTTAKMLAESVGATLVAIPSALVAAAGSIDPAEVRNDVIVALAVKGDDFWCTRCRAADDAWSIVGAAGLVAAGNVDLADVDRVVADEHLPEATRAASAARAVPVVEPRFAAGVVAKLARAELARGAVVDPLALAPLYPRQPEAVTLWNQRHGGSVQ